MKLLRRLFIKILYEISGLGAREVAELAKCFESKHEVYSLITSTHVNARYSSMHSHQSWESRVQLGPGGFLANWCSRIAEVQIR